MTRTSMVSNVKTNANTVTFGTKMRKTAITDVERVKPTLKMSARIFVRKASFTPRATANLSAQTESIGKTESAFLCAKRA